MTLLAPWWLAAGAAAALGLVALHLLAVGRPAPVAWPTARFVPVRAARARRLAPRPADRLLLAVRVAAVLLAALALARPTRTPARRPVARIVLADVSRAARDPAAVRDSVRALAASATASGDLLVAFDTTAAAPVAFGATPAARDSIANAALAPRDAAPAAGSLSAALAAARRAAPRLRAAADSIELVIVSPLLAREADAATRALRGAWAGRARLVRVAAAGDSAANAATGGVRVVARRNGLADDALAAAAGLVGARSATAVRIVRDGLTAADSAWARDSGGVAIDWAVDGVPAGWRRAARADTAGGVVAGDAAFVATMARRAAWPAGESIVVARWADGEPAATEHPSGTGCVRAVAVPVPQVGDAALRAPFLAFLAALAAPCAQRAGGAPLDSATVRALAGDGRLLAASTLAPPPAARDASGTWLLGAALALLAAELPLRRVGRRPDEGTASDDVVDAAAAARGATPGAAA
ncbi:MAG: BatA domain-containing protein [Gemmatirosa sp.]|nr:BatA domain-containing protein [Gemmatirosa sp.]